MEPDAGENRKCPRKCEDLSPESLNHLRAFVHRLFALAERRGLWTASNPASGVPRFRVAKRLPEAQGGARPGPRGTAKAPAATSNQGIQPASAPNEQRQAPATTDYCSNGVSAAAATARDEVADQPEAVRRVWLQSDGIKEKCC